MTSLGVRQIREGTVAALGLGAANQLQAGPQDLAC